MLDFRVEWLEAPGVKDQVLAKTWSRLEIQLDETGFPPRWLSSCVRTKSNSVQRGVYGPIFPLAEWVVENWWFLLHEPLRMPEYGGGRALTHVAQQRRWLQRHNFLAAREGGAFPDLAFYRDGPDVVACWVPDPDQDNPSRPTRFINGPGTTRMLAGDLEITLGRFVETVLERLDSASDEDTLRLRTNWTAIRQSGAAEAELCRWAASLGLDPYDPDELTDELADLLEHELASQPRMLRADLLEASSANMLTLDLDWVREASSKLKLVSDDTNGLGDVRLNDRGALTAHTLGYKKARDFRRSHGIPDRPLPDLVNLIHEKCGWPSDPEIVIEGCHSSSRLTMVGKDKGGLPRIIGGNGRRASSQRFRLARAIYFLHGADSPDTLRLITGAHTWDQRASRAFAAELLAPAALLRSAVGEMACPEDLENLADEFGVSDWVIELQLANHGIERIDAQ